MVVAAAWSACGVIRNLLREGGECAFFCKICKVSYIDKTSWHYTKYYYNHTLSEKLFKEQNSKRGY